MTLPTDTPSPPASGLTMEQVRARIARGQLNETSSGQTRTVAEIVRANVLTRFNFLITALLIVILVVAPIQDALFGLVMVVNTAIGIIQEVRAKRTLDRLEVLGAPRVRVVRDGVPQDVSVQEVVVDDLIELKPGDQLVVDCLVAESDGLEVDESLLTGEPDPVHKQPGGTCLSGSFVVAGSGRCTAEAVGDDAYAARLASEARQFTLVRSELREGIDWVLRMISWLLPPTMALLIWSQVSADQSLTQTVAGAVAGSIAAVPQGLVLLTSVAFAVGVIRLGRRAVLVRELQAVEGLARVDTVCFDKTGTLTTGRLSVLGIEPLVGAEDSRVTEIEQTLGALAGSDRSPNATLRAIASAYPSPEGWTPTARVPFASARQWSGATLTDRGSFVIGAPEVVAPSRPDLLARAAAYAADGDRVLLLAGIQALPREHAALRDVLPLALVRLGDQIRTEATATIDYFSAQGVEAMVVSGDHPATVSAIASSAGVAGADRVVDGRELPEDPRELARVIKHHRVFGRVAPHQKRSMIKALQASGHVVAMVGDGVNDVLALKDADLGIAMGSGSSASRSVAQAVLLDSDFTTLPDVVAEGRRVATNIERVANLFLTKTVYAFVLALAVAVYPIAFPFLPRHLTLVGSLTIGIPAFFLALEDSARPARPGFVGRVLRFAAPTGLVAATATFLIYLLSTEEGVTLAQGRTIASIVLGAVGVMALAMVSRPLNRFRRGVLSAVVGGFLLTFLIPVSRSFFALQIPRPVIVLAAIGVVALTGLLFVMGLRVSGWLATVTETGLQPIAREVTDGLDRVVVTPARRWWNRVQHR